MIVIIDSRQQKTPPCGGVSLYEIRSALMRGDGLGLRRWGFHRRHLVLHRLLHLLEGAHLDLADALAGDAELLRQLLERDRIVGQPPRLEDAALAVVEHAERRRQRLAAVV